MLKIDQLLGRGYFPDELPPPFTTKIYADLIANNYSSLPKEILEPKNSGKVSPHNRPRVGTLRRTLGIPNPIHQFILSDEIVKSWKTLERQYKKTKLSLSYPVVKIKNDRALSPRYPMSDLPKYRAGNRAIARYLLKTDITRFYHSIYTHSIPWALHTKSVAKKRWTDNRLLGNRLDRIIRNGQDKQTIGIPIGPDTSLVIAELLLCNIESSLPSVLRNAGFRYIDDFEMSFKTLSEAEDALVLLEEALNSYELSLNPKKTKIIKLPSPLEDIWVSELRVLPVSDDSNAKNQGYDLLRYFDRAFELAKKHPEDHVLNYAIQRLSSTLIHKNNWPLYQNLMLQCILAESGTLRFAFAQLTRYRQTGYKMDNVKIKGVINTLIEVNARLGHGNEVAWAIWSAMYFDVKILNMNARRLAKMEDSIVALLALDAQSKNLIDKSIDFSYWQSFMTTENLWDKQWLLTYEANIKGWLPSAAKRDHVNSDPAFKYLKKHEVYFYDEHILSKIKRKRLPEESIFLNLATLLSKY